VRKPSKDGPLAHAGVQRSGGDESAYGIDVEPSLTSARTAEFVRQGWREDHPLAAIACNG
jgi:hypothetical protein